MASDLTPERRAFLRDTANLESGIVLVAKEELIALLGMAERCADYDRRLSEVMPKDFKDWHDNGPKEWPEVAAGVIVNLRERLEQQERDIEVDDALYANVVHERNLAVERAEKAEAKAAAYDRLRQSQREQWSSITRDIVGGRMQNKQGEDA